MAASTRKTKRAIYYAKTLGMSSSGGQKEVRGESSWKPGRSRNKFGS